MLLVAIGGIHAGVGVTVAAEIREQQVRIAALQQALMECAETAMLAGREIVAAEPVDDGPQFLVGVVVVPRAVTLRPERGNLLDREAEDENILIPDLLADLDVGAVERADGERAVQRKFHVAGARGFLAGGGNLLGEVGGRNDLLGERHAVVRQERDL